MWKKKDIQSGCLKDRERDAELYNFFGIQYAADAVKM